MAASLAGVEELLEGSRPAPAASSGKDAVREVNEQTLAAWAEQCSAGFFTLRFTTGHDASLVRSDGKPLGTDGDVPITGSRFEVYASPVRRLSRRNRTELRQIYEAIRHVLYSPTSDAATCYGLARRDLGIDELGDDLDSQAQGLVVAMGEFARRNHL